MKRAKYITQPETFIRHTPQRSFIGPGTFLLPDGEGLDVLAIEPPQADNPLLTARNCHITPHLAWATRAARKRLLATATDNLRVFLAGEPRNVVTP